MTAPAGLTRRGAGAAWPVQYFALLGGVTAWTVHLVALAALTAPACTHGLTWLQNALTALTAVVTVAAIVASLRLIPDPATSGGDDGPADRVAEAATGPAEGSPGRPGGPAGTAAERSRLLGFLAVAFNVVSLLLILLEGVPVLVLNACRVA